VMPGRREDVADVLAAMDVFAFPSTANEGVPQAMAMRRPIVAAWVGGIPEVVRDGETGVLVSAGIRRPWPGGSVEYLRTRPAWRGGSRGEPPILSGRGPAARGGPGPGCRETAHAAPSRLLGAGMARISPRPLPIHHRKFGVESAGHSEVLTNCTRAGSRGVQWGGCRALLS